MITPTHVVTNALVARRSVRSAGTRDGVLGDVGSRRAFVWGGLAPDVGLYVLTGMAAAWFPVVRGWSLERTFTHVFDDLFYEDPVWVAVQNVLHAPFVVGALLVGGQVLVARGRPAGRRLRAFAAGCALHVAMDIPTHHDDGPLVWFPFDWSTRFQSPVSYWDPEHFGRIVAPIDLAITVVGGGWLLWSWRRARRAGTSLLAAPDETSDDVVAASAGAT